MFTVYVLPSIRNGRLYTGFTSRIVDERLREHHQSYLLLPTSNL